MGDSYGAGRIRFNLALDLFQAGRLEDALDYARAALADFEPFGARAGDMIEKARGLIGEIEKRLR